MSEAPDLDVARRRLLLTDDQLRVLRAVFDDVDVHQPGEEPAQAAALDQARTELQAAGLLAEGRMHPLPLDLVRVLALPSLRLVVEVLGPQGLALSHVAVAGTAVWCSEQWPGDDPDAPSTWSRSELSTVLWEVARLAGLRPRPLPEGAQALQTDLGTVDGLLLSLLTHGFEQGRDGALAAVLQDGAPAEDPAAEALTDPDRARWTALLAALQSSWRVTCVWGGGSGTQSRTLAVLDGGEQGYWQRHAPEPAVPVEDLHPGTPLRLEPVDGAALWQALADLLPSGAELEQAQPAPAGA